MLKTDIHIATKHNKLYFYIHSILSYFVFNACG